MSMWLFFIIALLPQITQAKDLTILAFGDSLSAGYGLARKDSFPQKLQQRLKVEGIGARVINGGVSGDTSRGGLARLEWMLLADPVDIVILELGANDGLRGLPPAKTKANLAKIIEQIQSKNMVVVLAGMKAPPNLGSDYTAGFNALYPYLAKRYDLIFFPFFLEGVVADLSLNQQDGIHPNPAGVDIIVDNILPYVQKAIAAVQKKQ